MKANNLFINSRIHKNKYHIHSLFPHCLSPKAALDTSRDYLTRLELYQIYCLIQIYSLVLSNTETENYSMVTYV